jgi:DNA-binding response OmpR family regulator
MPTHRVRDHPNIRSPGYQSVGLDTIPAQGNTALSGKVILLAEDDMLIAFDIVDFLKSAGGEVIGPFAGVSETLTAAATQDIDLAVLDINLRGEAVWPVVEVLRERGVQFLFLTGYPKSDLLQNTIWLEKPFVGETLLETLAALSKARAPRRTTVPRTKSD